MGEWAPFPLSSSVVWYNILGRTSMAIRIRAHFDGKVIVPDEPVDLPVGREFEADLHVEPSPEVQDDFERRKAVILRVAANGVRGTNIPLKALRRENLHGDDGR
jgi:hypothetical protein